MIRAQTRRATARLSRVDRVVPPPEAVPRLA